MPVVVTVLRAIESTLSEGIPSIEITGIPPGGLETLVDITLDVSHEGKGIGSGS